MAVSEKDEFEQSVTVVVEGTVQGTEHDALDMHRLGKKQEFKRNFAFLSTLGFVSIFISTWEFVFVSLAAGLVNGGFAGLFWTFIGVVFCYGTIVLSLAEMESMAPTSGGQYHWVSEFAPPKYQRFLSYSAGWMSSLGWLASAASGNFVCATLIQSMVDVENADFAFPNWQYTLIMLAFVVVFTFFNTRGASLLPAFETVALAGHLGLFLVFVIPIWVMAPKNSASEVFTSFVDSGNWGSIGLACLVAQTSIVYCNLGKPQQIEGNNAVSNHTQDPTVSSTSLRRSRMHPGLYLV